MKNKFNFLSLVIFSLSSLISISSCGLFSNNEETSGQNENQNNDKDENNENNGEGEDDSDSTYTLNFTSFDVIDLEKYNYSPSNIRREYILNKPKDYFTLQLNFYNPHKLKVTEVTVSGVTYDEKSLDYSSDYSKVDVKIQSNEDYGAQFYKITEVGYFNGKKESHLGIPNSKFVLRVKENNKLKVSNFSYTATATALNIKFNINDKDNVTKVLPLKYKLIDKDSTDLDVIKDESLKLGDNNLLIDDLKEFNNYEFVIYYGKYLTLENGSDYFVDVSKHNLQTLKAIDITNISPSYEKVTFKINNIENVNVRKMYLKNKTKNTEEKHTTSIVEEFSNIFSDTDYSIVLEYTFKEKDYVREYDFKTKAYVAPSFKFKSYNAKHQTVSYEIEFDDPLNFVSFYKVELVGLTTKTLNTLKGTFENCISGVTYNLVINYYYDLKDGNGRIAKEVKTQVTTDPVDISDISLNLTFNGKNSLDYALNVNNREDITLNSVELYHLKDLIETKEDNKLTGTFSNLINEREYLVKAYYEVSLPGENSTYTNSISKKIKMRSLTNPDFNLETTPNKKGVSYKLTKTDPDNVFKFHKVILYKNNEFIDDSLQSNGSFSDLLSGNKYTLRLLYTLNFNNDVTPRSVTKDYEFVTDTFSVPYFEISNVEVGAIRFACNVTLNDPTNAIVPNSIVTIVSDKNINHRKSYKIDNYEVIGLNNLYSCTSHVLTISYKYDLNDGTGEKSKVFSYDFRTLEQIVVTQFSITPLNYNDPELRSFDIHIVFENPDHLNFGEVVINGVALRLKSIPTSEINLNVGDIFNYVRGEKNTLDAFITTTDISYDVFIKYPYG